MSELPVLSLLLATLIVALGTAVQASIGFGLALIAAPLLHLLDPVLVPAPLIMTAWTLSLWVVWQEWDLIDLANFKAALAGRLIGSPLAAVVVGLVSAVVFDLIFASLVLLAVGMSLLHSNIRPSTRNVFCAMVASGFMGTISGIGGPPLALVYQNVEGRSLRANLGMLFLLGTSVSLLSLSLVGRFGFQEMRNGLILQLGVAMGIVVSGPLRRKLDQTRVRPILLALCAASALVVLLRALGELL